VTLNLDSSLPIRSLARQRELIVAIHSAPTSTQETSWVEWKSRVDIGEKRWQTELSRQVLGMANRDPEVATNWAEGCAFVVVGVSPGDLLGTAVYDSAKIEAWLTAYVGRAPNAPQWAHAYVEMEGKAVLILTIEPPHPGQPAWPCRKSYFPDSRTGEGPRAGLRDGAVYVRHQASTVEANSADIEMLSRRAAGSRRRIAGISLLLAPNCRAISLETSEDEIRNWADREREALRPPPSPEPDSEISISELSDPSLLVAAKLAERGTEMARRFTERFLERDERTPEAYEAEVKEYTATAMEVLPFYLMRRAHELKLGRIALSVRNNTDDPIHRLQVEVAIEVKGVTAVSDDLDLAEVTLPERPIMLGNATRLRVGGLTGLTVPSYYDHVPRLLTPSRVRIDNSNSARLTFDPIDLYPQETADLDEFCLLTTGDGAGSRLNAEWNARAGDMSGVIRGILEIPVDPNVPTIDELLAMDE
jgi:hypothetical protein